MTRTQSANANPGAEVDVDSASGHAELSGNNFLRKAEINTRGSENNICFGIGHQ